MESVRSLRDATAPGEVAPPFGQLLRAFRRSRDLSQAALAGLSGVAARAIGALENGERKAPHRETVARLANALELSSQDAGLFEAAAQAMRTRTARHLHATPLFARRVSATGMIGRDAAVRDLDALLAANRLITLAGFGGIGKSCLALAVAAEAAKSRRRRVEVVDCADLSALDQLVAAVARSLDVSSETISLPDLIETMSAIDLLLVLDNCEAVANAVRRFVVAVIDASASTTLLVTSRHRLMLSNECIYPVDALATDAARELLIQRSRCARDSATLPAADIFEGIPLVIEIAAPLHDRRHLADETLSLCNTAPEAPSHHASLTASLDRSYDLLDPAEQTLLQRLSVFTEAFDGAAVERVCSDDALLASPLPVLATLVEKSLVNVSYVDGQTLRYTLFGVTRAYGARKLGHGQSRGAAGAAQSCFTQTAVSTP